TSNEKIKQIALFSQKASARKEEGVFIAEGTKLVREAPGDLIREIYISESCLEKEKESILKGLDDKSIVVSDRVFEKISTMKSPQGMLAVISSLSYKKEDITKGNPLILILEDIQDPGNVGTIFRTAEAAGVTGIVLSEKCADPLSPKVVRSTMGAIFRMPFIISPDILSLVKEFENDGINCFAARLENGKPFYECDLTGKCAIIIGNEGSGLSPEVNGAASCGIYIPMNGGTESLNAAVSASILSYEAGRQRKII
ncbi:MAG: RNA methyltransferase, partial [Lachnospiraceae bacterium]|nr:RNA methyltransferase [Lachnospiraceae bacterium]